MTLNPLALKVSSYCSTGACVGVGLVAQSIVMIDTKATTTLTAKGLNGIAFNDKEWTQLIENLTSSEAIDVDATSVSTEENGDVIVARDGETSLHFLPHEWDAFCLGAADGEFDVDILRTASPST